MLRTSQSIKYIFFRELGVAWWLRNNNTLRRLIEKVAKASFQASQDPLDAAIFYLAMKKKSLVWGLYRSIKDERMTTFFKNNFSEDRWRKAALKNAFALLGKILLYKQSWTFAYVRPGNIGSLGQRTAKLLAVKNGGIKEKSAPCAITTKFVQARLL